MLSAPGFTHRAESKMVKNLRVVVTNDVASVPNWKSRACTHTWPSADDAQKHARKKEAEEDAARCGSSSMRSPESEV